MSALVRQTLAEAASAVDGITVTPYFAQSTSPGSGAVRLERIEYPDKFGGVVRWNVFVLLPQETAAAEKYIDEKVPAIREALRPHMTVTAVEPQRLDISGVGVVPVVFINGIREEG